jgi:mono/diheme cytochrome c family protein
MVRAPAKLHPRHTHCPDPCGSGEVAGIPAEAGGQQMRFIAIALIVGAGAAAAAAAQDGKAARGEQLYAEQKCGLCHSIADKGNKKGPLDGVGTKLSNDELRQWIVDAKGMTAKTSATRKPDMKNYALPKEDVDALVGYMASLKKK